MEPEKRVSGRRVHLRHLADAAADTKVTSTVGENTSESKVVGLEASVKLEESGCGEGEGNGSISEGIVDPRRLEVTAQAVRIFGQDEARSESEGGVGKGSIDDAAFALLVSAPLEMKIRAFSPPPVCSGRVKAEV
jgi:hypothetical protein